MTVFSWIFLSMLVLTTGFRLWLSQRQRNHVTRHRDAVPQPFRERISLEDHRKAADYTVAKLGLARLETAFDALLLLAWTLGGGIALVDRLVHGIGMDGTLAGTVVIMTILVSGTLLGLPFSVIQTFGIEARYGFNRATPALFASDTIKGVMLSLLIGGPLVWGVLWIMANTGTSWWLFAWVLWTGFVLAMTWLYPTFIAPIFNRFKPLEDQQLRQRVEQLLQRCGFHSKGIFVMDGSRRSAHGNAYFTGIGNNKRIVFFDTLIEALRPEEIEAVLAHELGHFRRHHVRKRLLVMLLSSLLGLGLLGWLKLQPWFYGSLGVPAVSDHAALILFVMVSPIFTYFLSPLGAVFSRRHEFEADAYAAGHSSAACLVDALVKLYRDNASTLTPDPLHSAFYDSHPPALSRIAQLERLASQSS